LAGSELTRLLARLADTPMALPRPAFAERLGHWLGWPGAVALSAALNAGPAPTGAGRLRRCGDEEADFQRVRAALQASIAAGPREPASSPTDFGPHRRHCIAQQQAMQRPWPRCASGCATHWPGNPPGRAPGRHRRVLEQALAPQERRLLGLVLLRLQARFERLQHTAAAERPWHETFRDDRDRVLQAELAHRLLPAQGLLDALRNTRTT
jgi:hypothetical protein